jgi:hypothetical protein
MKYPNKKIFLKESGGYSAPKNKNDENDDYKEFIDKFLGKIFLSKKVFFGIDSQKIALLVTPSLKIVMIVSHPKKLTGRFPQKVKENLNADLIKDWAEKNGFEISFKVSSSSLKSKFYSLFGDVLVEDMTSINESERERKEVLEELKNSSLPDSVKNWAIENPEKFKKHINEIKKLLGK